MKVILDLDDALVNEMNQYCSIQKTSIDKIISNLFTTHVIEPAKVIDKLVEHEGNMDELKNFQHILSYYLLENINDIDSLIGTGEEDLNDKYMLEVFKGINHNYLSNSKFLTDLFQIYWDEKNK